MGVWHPWLLVIRFIDNIQMFHLGNVHGLGSALIHRIGQQRDSILKFAVGEFRIVIGIYNRSVIPVRTEQYASYGQDQHKTRGYSEVSDQPEPSGAG